MTQALDRPPWRLASEALVELSSQAPDVDHSTLANAQHCLEHIGTTEPSISLGYWRNSIRLVWSTYEIEVWNDHLELYPFQEGAQFVFHFDFAPGQDLPITLIRELQD